MDSQTCDSKNTCRRSTKHTRRKAGEQFVMLSTPRTLQISNVRTSAPTWRMIRGTARAPERWWDDHARWIYIEQVTPCLQKQFGKRWTMISEHSKQSTKCHAKIQSPNWLMRDGWDNCWEMMTEHTDQDHCWMTPNWDWIRGLWGALPTEGTYWDGGLPNDFPNWMMHDNNGVL